MNEPAAFEPICLHNDVRIFHDISAAFHWASRYAIGGGIAYRGQVNIDWDWVPSLMRLESNRQQDAQADTMRFIESFLREFHQYSTLNEPQLLAIAQHYGFQTKLLDFTFNPKVAAFFASPGGKCQYRYGELAFVSLREHSEMQNPFEPLGLSKAEAKGTLSKDSMYVGECEAIHVPGVPRIERQEAVFIHGGDPTALRTNFLDRYGFLHRAEKLFIDPKGPICFEYLFPEDDPIYEFVVRYDPSKSMRKLYSYGRTHTQTTMSGSVKKKRMSTLRRLIGTIKMTKTAGAEQAEEYPGRDEIASRLPRQDHGIREEARALKPVVDRVSEALMACERGSLELYHVENIRMVLPERTSRFPDYEAALDKIRQAINMSSSTVNTWDECLTALRGLLAGSLNNRPSLGPHNPGSEGDWYDAALSIVSESLVKVAHVEYVRLVAGDFGARQEAGREQVKIQSARGYLAWILD